MKPASRDKLTQQAAKNPVAQPGTKLTASVPKVSNIKLSWDVTDIVRAFLIYGAFGAGKSTLAATASRYWPKEGLPTTKWGKKTPKVVLEDMLFILTDPFDPLGGLRERGIAVPCFDVNAWIKEKPGRTALDAIAATYEEAARFVTGGGKWLVHDTVTSWDSLLEAYCRKNMPLSKGGKDDSRRMYGMLYQYNLKIHHLAVGLGINIIYNAHYKSSIDFGELTPAQLAAAKATQSAGGIAAILPAITGKAQAAYKGGSTFVLALVKQVAPGSKGSSRKLYTIATTEMEAKNRYELSLPPIMEADMREVLRLINGGEQ